MPPYGIHPMYVIFCRDIGARQGADHLGLEKLRQDLDSVNDYPLSTFHLDVDSNESKARSGPFGRRCRSGRPVNVRRRCGSSCIIAHQIAGKARCMIVTSGQMLTPSLF